MPELETPTPEPRRDVNAFRLPQNFAENLGVRKVLTHIPVQKPSPDRFFRAHPSATMEFHALIYEDKAAREIYAVVPSLADFFGRLAKPVVLHLAVDRRGNPFLIPVPLPSTSGSRNPWHESLAQAIEKAKTDWVRIASNLAAGVYDIFVATAGGPPPEWPDKVMDELVQLAMNGKIIDSSDHPVIQGLQGKI
jgi:hypothetical protein